ncbi:putative forkhead-like transcriptional regulator [Moniliophthora roreri MCA 2997]|uniref:Forkhead-like transcriptional regulator n=2 Tax=Moniliophthora roreri TaxID=221103 RepID=V2X3S1_MONRO|nr:putative forkhead-like transcriptional regulator [Moniliophthora roreri MCA 2997]KAI3596737.1 putative forkhead-like transcriptional regulator [Moniliophthora roreri]
MQTRSASRSPEPMPIVDHDDQQLQQSSKISAYYSLVFPHFTFYIQTLSVTIGRRVAPSAQTASSSSAADPVQVDVDLGALKSVSRLHAKIEYDQEQDRFVLQVIGRNGAWVDGVWQGSGTRAALGERSQIQIASRIFHFVLPPPPPPEDTPSPSEHSDSHSPLNNNSNRARSPSLDITSISPPSSLPDPPEDPSVEAKPPTPPPPAPATVPAPASAITTNAKSGSSKPTTSKKRKKSDLAAVPPPPPPRPKPEEMPPKPALTYAQLIFRAIKALDGKATLQEICNWIAKEFEYYRYVEGNAWTSSVRHNLSSGRAFKKMERCGGDRGKGFFWSLDEAHLHTLEEQDARMEHEGGKGKKKEKAGAPLSEPPLKKSVKDAKSAALPPPLTSTPLERKTASKTTPIPVTAATTTTSVGGDQAPATNQSQTIRTGVFSYQQLGPNHPQSSLSPSNPYAVLTQGPWAMHGKYPHHNPYLQAHSQAQHTPGSPQVQSQPKTSTSGLATVPAPPLVTASTATFTVKSPPLPAAPVAAPSPSTLVTTMMTTTTATTAKPPTQQPQIDFTPSIPPALESVVVPIVIGLPPNSKTNANSTTTKQPPMVLHESKIYLDPEVFKGLNKDMLEALEKLGARQAISVLTGHMTRVLKERESLARKKKKEKKEKKKDKKGKGKDGGSGVVAPPATAPVAAMEVDTTSAPSALAATTPARPDSPIIIIDDDDDSGGTRHDEGPAPKRRRVEVEFPSHGMKTVPVS